MWKVRRPPAVVVSMFSVNDGSVRQFVHCTKNAQAGIISNQCRIFVQLVEAAKVEMSLIESFAGDYRRWSRIERIVSPAFLIAALGGVASMFTPLLGG
jgi:hypothetical protein